MDRQELVQIYVNELSPEFDRALEDFTLVGNLNVELQDAIAVFFAMSI